MNDFRNFLEVSRDFHRKISKHERISAYYSFALSTGTAAILGAGVYIAESDPIPGLITAGLGVYATKTMVGIGRDLFEMSKKNADLAEERQYQLDNFEEFFPDESNED